MAAAALMRLARLPGTGAIRGYLFCGLYLFLLFVLAICSSYLFLLELLAVNFYPFEYKG